MIFKCKICGGDLNIERGQSIVECEYCGVRQTLPRFIDENTKLMYDRANNYLMHNEFDKAENIYNQILFADREDADAYWNLVLCKYGISYVKDPKTQKYVPTCNRTYYSSIFDDENYKNAIKYADAEKAELFKADAKTIDDIQRGIVAISRKEKPFDIFISYKETGVSGGRTKDSIAAQELYEKLTNEGYKVFFSRITLEDKIGTEYEPYIYAALASSKVMITVCSSKENVESVWVKNEWSRFMSFMQKDSAKTILPLYFDMDKSDLPDEFAHLPSHDMKTDGFEQDLLRGIKKLIPLPIMEKERREKRKKLIKKIGIGAAACLVIAAICMIPWFMKLPDYNAAMQLYYDKNYPEATWAFDELGSYRNAKAMKDKCEKSWRKSLANTVVNHFALGSYYITQNNTIDEFNLKKGTANKKIEINEHGKIVSIEAGSEDLCALYEDGYVYNNRTEASDDLNNVIQISPVFNQTFVALKSNGKMVFGDPDYDVSENGSANRNDKWLADIAKWDNIISFDYYRDSLMSDAAIVGVKSDGKICAVSYSPEFHPSVGKAKFNYEESLSKFYDVKCIDVSVNASISDQQLFLNIVALTNHGSVQTYLDGVFEEHDIDDAISIYLLPYSSYGNAVYCLFSDGGIRKEKDSRNLLEDVVYFKDSFAVTRNGTIYAIDYDDIVGDYSKFSTNSEKTAVYNEWLERMK